MNIGITIVGRVNSSEQVKNYWKDLNRLVTTKKVGIFEKKILN